MIIFFIGIILTLFFLGAYTYGQSNDWFGADMFEDYYSFILLGAAIAFLFMAWCGFILIKG